MDELRVSSEFVFVIWIFVIRILARLRRVNFVLRASDLNYCVIGPAPFQGAS